MPPPRAHARSWDTVTREHADDAQLVCVDVDATLVTAHSDKKSAAGTYKRGYGFDPLLATSTATTAPGSAQPQRRL